MKSYLLLPFALFLAGCSHEESKRAETAAPAPPIQVKTRAITLQDWPATYEAPGTVKARITGVVSAKVMGYVRQVNANVGDRVREGQVLITLDARDLEANVRRAEAGRSEVDSALPEADAGVAAAKAALDLAQTTFKRMEELASKRSISRQELDEATARLRGAEANYEMTRAKRRQLDFRRLQVEHEVHAASITRDYTTIAAPFFGVVVTKLVEPGNLASPGAPLLTIEREGSFRLEASIDESRLGAVRVGQAVSVKLDSFNRNFACRVSEIVPSVDPASRTYIAKIDLPAAPELKTGLFGRALFPAGAQRVTVAPAGAIIERGQLQSVFVAENGSARSRLVTTGRRNGGDVELLSGLNPGEKIVYPLPPALQDGARVEVRE